MSHWTPDRSALLSLLLDDVTGTKTAVDIRQDFCQLEDCIKSNIAKNFKIYFTGSKAEGLDLPGSDNDYMFDINDGLNFEVVQSVYESTARSPYAVFYLCTENSSPGFALLRCIKPGINPILNMSIESAFGAHYLSSSLMADTIFPFFKMHLFNLTKFKKTARQGPSFEHWTIYEDPSESGTDMVPSIHCAFWPKDASEWVERQRPFGWPTPHDVSTIVNFGCHLVGIGHPQSETSSLEWRISFSMAERALVWSFNHVQIQCYALMKIILKEYIKQHCNPRNQVLCSYFIKTFLFWKYEANDLIFWRKNNLQKCIKYLLIEFRHCLKEGVIRHFFFPRFNLLSVKLTPEAKVELLQLLDIIIQSDITILRECNILKNIWSKLISADRNQMNVIHNERRRNFLKNDKILMNSFYLLTYSLLGLIEITSSLGHRYPSNVAFSQVFHFSLDYTQLINQIWTLPCKSCLKLLVIKAFILHKLCNVVSTPSLGNRYLYGLVQFTANDNLAFDISTYKLWCAMLFVMKGDYASTLRIVNQVLCSIPSFAMYMPRLEHGEPTAIECLYVDKYLHSECNTMERVKGGLAK